MPFAPFTTLKFISRRNLSLSLSIFHHGCLGGSASNPNTPPPNKKNLLSSQLKLNSRTDINHRIINPPPPHESLHHVHTHKSRCIYIQRTEHQHQIGAVMSSSKISLPFGSPNTPEYSTPNLLTQQGRTTAADSIKISQGERTQVIPFPKLLHSISNRVFSVSKDRCFWS